MRIAIALRLRPFSHTPGARCLIPYTTWEVEAFPALLRFHNLETGEKKEVPLAIKGPLKGFTLFQDLERGRVELIRKGEDKLFITPEAFPFLEKVDLPPSTTRFSFGVHKKQDWDLVSRRCEMTEIFPFWVRLSQLIPPAALPQEKGGTLPLLEKVEDGLFFQAGFQGILSPRLNDERHLGITDETPIADSPLGLLHKGAEQILRLFFLEEKGEWHILPHLPKEFHAGRIVSLITMEGDRIDLEWSKKRIKKMVLRPTSSQTIQLVLKKGLKSFRVRKSMRQKGERVAANEPLSLKPNQTLFLDRFMV